MIAAAAIVLSIVAGAVFAARARRFQRAAADIRLELAQEADRRTRADERVRELEQALAAERARADRELAEHGRVEGESAGRTAALQRAGADLEQKIYTATHDMQVALGIVTNAVQTLAAHVGDDPDSEVQRSLGLASGAARRAQELLDDLLMASQVGAAAPSVATVDMNEALQAAEDHLRPAMAEAGAVVTRDVLPPVRGDRVRIVQLLETLLSNAVKFRTQAPPRIHATMTLRHGQTCFSIADNGIGIDPAHHQRIFELFERLNGTRYAGSGLGLAIARNVVLRHGGRIWVESRPGQGAIFFFTLPGSA